jgi:hypothetical protein
MTTGAELDLAERDAITHSTEPDPDNAGVGREHDYDSHSPLSNERGFLF